MYFKRIKNIVIFTNNVEYKHQLRNFEELICDDSKYTLSQMINSSNIHTIHCFFKPNDNIEIIREVVTILYNKVPKNKKIVIHYPKFGKYRTKSMIFPSKRIEKRFAFDGSRYVDFRKDPNMRVHINYDGPRSLNILLGR